MIAARKYSKDTECVYYWHQFANQYHWFVPQSSHWLLPNISWKYIPFIYWKRLPRKHLRISIDKPLHHVDLFNQLKWVRLAVLWLAGTLYEDNLCWGVEGRALGMLWSTCIFIGPIPDYCTLLVFHATQYILIPNQLGELTNIKNKRDNNYK